MLNALVLMLLTGPLQAGQPEAIQCEFPGNTDTEQAILVSVAPQPSLRDRPGLFRVQMEMNGVYTMAASVQPISGTDERDVMIRTSTGGSTLAIGLRDDGRAALSLKATSGDATRTGDCRGYDRYLRRWLTL